MASDRHTSNEDKPEGRHFTLVRADEGEALWHLGTLVIFKATSANTGEQFALSDNYAPQGVGPMLHVHERDDESFYVLEGEIGFQVGDETISASAGDFLLLPYGVPHRFWIKSERARFLVLSTPAGLDRFIQATAKPAPARTLPPPPAGPPGREEYEQLVNTARQYGYEILGPPPA
jgi:quercetin dioxygenase-like cupin family protein